ncbi:hypothetical protein [Nitrosospira multiformis]|uniref:hypothetical protein n=1 Tax=Nitrosospira multiformis TaxID=1231 RepID=UPI00089D2E9C|nr:hypothetical protein [Nitrosospira multiformis]SEA62747.1 hypothetical protein SAMN05216411_11537 [Nitrosospira multiformis]
MPPENIRSSDITDQETRVFIEEALARERRALADARLILSGKDRSSVEEALERLPIPPSDVELVRMALSIARIDTRAMMLGRAAGALVEFGDGAAGLGIARALEEFWTGSGQTDERYHSLARVEIGSALVTQARALVRLGQVDRAVTLVDAHPGLHDRQRYLKICAAEGLARNGRFDEARAILPPDRPQGDIAEENAWDVAHNLLEGVYLDPDDHLLEDVDPDSDEFRLADGKITEYWQAAIDKLMQAIENMGRQAGLPSAVVSLIATRLQEERAKVPTTKAEFVKRLNRLREAMRGGRGQ